MNFTYAGMIALFVMILALCYCRFKLYLLLTSPLFLICLTFFQFFGHYSLITVSAKTEVLLVISFLVFLAFYTIGKRVKTERINSFLDRFIHRKYSSGYLLVKSRKPLFIYFIFVVLYILFDLWLNTYIYGSLLNALTRFYAKQPEAEVPNILITLQNFVYRAIVAFVFIFRYFQNRYKQRSSLIYIVIALLVFIALPKGSRGAAILPVLLMFMADLFSKKNNPRFLLRNKIREYIVFGIAILFIVFSLTLVRGINFEDAEELIELVKVSRLSDGIEEYGEHETDLMLQDADFTFENFGKKYDYLGLHYTAYSLIINPIPRFIYPNKPVGFGIVLAEAKHGSGDFSVRHLSEVKTGFAVGVAGEGWANGGIIGLLFYSVLMGMYSGFFAKLYYRYINSDKIWGLMLAMQFFLASRAFIRGDIHSGVTQSIYPIILTMLFIAIFSKKLRSSDH